MFWGRKDFALWGGFKARSERHIQKSLQTPVKHSAKTEKLKIDVFSTTNLCKNSVSEMTVKIGISVLLGEILEMFVLKRYQTEQKKSTARGDFFKEQLLGLQDFDRSCLLF